tara:strand:- start:874 stop:1350 length:477 start_codon:yes stop_codon:yes gene_type:complete
MPRKADTKEKPNNEYKVLDINLMHQDLDCDKCSNFIDTHISLKRNSVIPSVTALASHFKINKVDKVGVHLNHLEAAGIAKITDPKGDPWKQGHTKMIKIDVSDYEFVQKMPEDQLLTETDNMIEMLDGTFITLEEAKRRLKNIDWANGEKVSIYAGRN